MYITCTTFVPGVCSGQKRALGPFETGVVDGCDLLCGSWEQNPGLLQEKAFLTTAPESPSDGTGLSGFKILALH